MQDKMISKKRTARIAGALYLLLAIFGIFGLLYVPSRIVVHENVTATVQNIMSSELLYRLGIASNLIGQTCFLFLVLVLYRLFKEIDKNLALSMLTLVVVAVPMAFINELNHVAVLLLLGEGEFLKAFDPDELHALIQVFLNLFDNGNYIVEIFWGLWLFPFGLLIWKSGFIPKIFGIFLIMACFSYVIESFTVLLIPHHVNFVSWFASLCGFVGEFSILLWLLIKGVKSQQPAAGVI